MTNKTEHHRIYFSRLFRRITAHETVNIIIVIRSITTETSYDIVHRYTYKCKKLNSLKHPVRTTVAGSHN